MKSIVFSIIFLLSISMAFAVTGPFVFNTKEYYTVFGDNPAEDTGNEVCAQLGKTCVGYTEPTVGVCNLAHPNAASTSSWSGDKAGVYCHGAPQSGVCATKTDTCHACPQCTKTVACNTPIGGLYKEMYVECKAGNCRVFLGAQNVQELKKEIPGVNNQLANCPVALPSGASSVLGNGDTLVNIKMNSGKTEQITMTIKNKQITGVRNGGGACTQQVDVAENDVNSILASSNRGQTAAYFFGIKKFKVRGCSIWSSIKLTFANPIGRRVVRSATPTPPPPPPPPNCGNVGEQCNNRGCFSGMCGSPKERNSGGQWGHWNYRCMNQQEYTANCIGRGNTPPAWSCLTGICR